MFLKFFDSSFAFFLVHDLTARSVKHIWELAMVWAYRHFSLSVWMIDQQSSSQIFLAWLMGALLSMFWSSALRSTLSWLLRINPSCATTSRAKLILVQLRRGDYLALYYDWIYKRAIHLLGLLRTFSIGSSGSLETHYLILNIKAAVYNRLFNGCFHFSYNLLELLINITQTLGLKNFYMPPVAGINYSDFFLITGVFIWGLA